MLATAIWDGLKLRAWEQCIIKVGHAEKSRAVPKEGSRLKTGAGRSVTHFKKELKKKMIRSRLDMAQQTVYSELEMFAILWFWKKFMTISISNCSCGAKNGGLFAELCISVARGRERGREIVRVLQILGLFWVNSGVS